MINAVTILMTTWAPNNPEGGKRSRAAIESIISWTNHLYYDGTLNLHISDDGSSLPDYPESLMGGHMVEYFDRITYSRQDRHGVGASWNSGVGAIPDDEVILHAVDDWLLIEYLDLTPWVELLKDSTEIGAIRLGPPHPGLTGVCTLTTSGWVVRLARHNFVFSFRPTLFHKRFFHHYGRFDEDMSALETERLYNLKYCDDHGGPSIVLALPELWRPHEGSPTWSGQTPIELGV